MTYADWDAVPPTDDFKDGWNFTWLELISTIYKDCP